MSEHHLEPKYLTRLAQLEQLHPPAFRFLTRLQVGGSEHGLWLSTATNVHICKDQAFLMYVRLQGPKPDVTSIVLSPDYNNVIAQNATDQSRLLFPRAMERMIMGLRGFSTLGSPDRQRRPGDQAERARRVLRYTLRSARDARRQRVRATGLRFIGIRCILR